MHVQYSYQKLTTYTTIAGINYKGQFDCKWDLMILTNYIIINFKFFFINIWPDDSLFRPKIVANIWNNEIKWKLCQTECFIWIYYNTTGVAYCCVWLTPETILLSFNYYYYLLLLLHVLLLLLLLLQLHVLLLLLLIGHRVRSYNHFRQRPIH
jgi:hypothetical protein